MKCHINTYMYYCIYSSGRKICSLKNIKIIIGHFKINLDVTVLRFKEVGRKWTMRSHIFEGIEPINLGPK